MSKKQNDELLAEAVRINYRLRSTFFYRKLNEYHTYEFPIAIQRLLPISKKYDWENYNKWGISENALNQIKKSELELIQVFCHPRLLRENPYLTAYYRNIATLSQKSVLYLSKLNVKKFENKIIEEMNETQATILSKLFNEHISLIIESALEKFGKQHIVGLLFASTGAQIDGSWRNSIGDEAQKIVEKMLIKETIDKKQLTLFLLRDSSKGVEHLDLTVNANQLDRSDEFRGFTLRNKKSIVFSSEPDISIIDKDGSTIAIIEVKGGNDPAGALERYGAAKKSFEEALKDNPKVVTILLASCITSEVEKRVKEDKTIKNYFNLTSILTNEKQRKEFLDYLFSFIF